MEVVSSGNEVTPLVIGVDTLAPPTSNFSSLDEGGVFGVPNAVNSLSKANPELDPENYGIDFWESLVGELVTIKDTYLVSRPNQYGEAWARGNWEVTGLNEHGGVTMLDGGELRILDHRQLQLTQRRCQPRDHSHWRPPGQHYKPR